MAPATETVTVVLLPAGRVPLEADKVTQLAVLLALQLSALSPLLVSV